VYDVPTGRLVEVDPVLADVLPLYGPLGGREIAARLAERHAPDAIARAVDEIETARWTAGLFADRRPVSVDTLQDEEGLHVQPRGVQHLAITVSEDCNLRCGYCLHTTAAGGVRPHRPRHMDPATARQAMRFFLGRRDPERPASVSFYGGEPLLALPAIRAALAAAPPLDDPHRPVFSLDTNLTLVDDEVCDLVAREKLWLQISLDGPASVHDRHRRDRRGRPTHRAVETAIGRLLRHEPEIHARMRFQVTLAPPFDLPAVLDYFADLPPYRAAGVSARPLVRVNLADTSGLGLPAASAVAAGRRWHEQLDAARAEYIRVCREGRRGAASPALLALFDPALIRIRHRPGRHPSGRFVFGLGACCQPGEPRLHVGADGTLQPCERQGERAVIGDVATGIASERVQELRRRFRAAVGDRCRDCWAVHLCGVCFTALPAGLDDEPIVPEAVCEAVRQRQERSLKLYLAIVGADERAWEWLRETSLG